MPSRLILFVLLIAMAAPLGACGRRGALEEPEGSTYPRAYPAEYNAPSDAAADTGPKDADDKNNKNK